MMDKDMAEPLLNPRFPDDPLYLPCYIISTPAPGLYLDALLVSMML